MLPGGNTLQCVYQSVKYNADNFTTKTKVKSLHKIPVFHIL